MPNARLEKAVDMIVFSLLRQNGYVDGAFNSKNNVEVWAKKSTNNKINGLLKSSSKNKKGNLGFPEYIIFHEKEELVIVIENKKETKFHYKEPLTEDIQKYAVNGALWYASFLKDEFNVIAIGISGNSVEDLVIDTFAWKKGSEFFNNLNLNKIYPIENYTEKLSKSNIERSSKESFLNLNKKANDINQFLRDVLGVIEHERLYVLGSILYALEDPIFRVSYPHTNNAKDLATFLFQTVERKVKGSNVKEKQLIIDELKPVLLGLGINEKRKLKEKYPNGILAQLIRDIDNILFEYHSNREIDLMSTFFNVFLSYSTSGGSDLGIVLTPTHITNLFCELADIKVNSKILDICVGTGGFLTSAWRKIALDEELTHSQKEAFRLANLYGIEKERNIYTIVALNMFINKDGKSNLLIGDAFELSKDVRSFECNVGFINPPYSDSIYSEIAFVELMLDNLLPNSVGVAIIPVNAVSGRTKKHADIHDVKKRILNKHSLIASIQMPSQLFYPKGTETIVLVFKTGVPNSSETWLAKYDDGFELIKHQKARTPTAQSKENYEYLIDSYRKRTETDFSFLKLMTENDQWVYTIHEDVNYFISESDLQETVNEYVSYLYLNGYK